jgi:hypothetical protein
VSPAVTAALPLTVFFRSGQHQRQRERDLREPVQMQRPHAGDLLQRAEETPGEESAHARTTDEAEESGAGVGHGFRVRP